MAHGRTCLSVVVASLLVSGTSLRADGPSADASQELPPQQRLPLSNSRNLLAMDPSAFAQFLKTARPAPVSAEDKARVLSSLPEEGEVTNLNAAARQKLAALVDVLRATERASVYEIKVIAVPQAAIGLHGRAVILISEAALTLVDADELQALLAHEIAHEYVWTERERAFQLADRIRLKDLELVCDAIAIVTLHGLGMDVSRLMTGVQKISRFNRERFGTAINERDYPTVAQRRAFAGAVATWTSARTTGTR
jgi:Peptidase family M48